MFWIDEIAEEIDRAFPDKEKEIVFRDEKTASGKVHIGSLRGVAIHGILAEALRQRGRKAVFMFEINDVDPMDGLPVYLNEAAYKPFMGKPLKDVPAPDDKGFPTSELTREKNFARHYGNEFIEVIKKLKIEATFVWASDFYEGGTYDPWIEKVCMHPTEIRDIYKRVSGSEKPESWFPLQMVCEQCGKVGTTTVFNFENGLATYHCEPSKVSWAEGCGHQGQASPFNGRGKLPWKVEWAVKWAGVPVDVEGSGKDHNAAGGSHDVSTAICREVLEAPVPFNLPYEFFLFGGAKMSASKGLGATAKEVSDLMPPELLRFLMLRTKPKQPIDFNIDGDTIPRLYDNHDQCADVYFKTVAGEPVEAPDLGRPYYFAQLDQKKITPHYLPRFSRIAFIAQIPHLELATEVEKMKGESLTKEDIIEAEERSEFVKLWLDNFAEENAKFIIQEAIPAQVNDLSPDQKNFLQSIANALEAEPNLDGEALHGKIHELRKASPLEARDGFGAIYAALLGKSSGPQAGWFLEALDRDFVIQRFKDVAML